MSSNLRLTRICEHCGDQFIARTSVTKFCGQPCASRAYKARFRKRAVERSDEETISRFTIPIVALQAQNYLSVRDVCSLLGVSRWTIYRVAESGRLPMARLGRRIVIKKDDIERLFPR
ncbi:MAG: helix-turn-helix domain-containing protein [Pyrinomonadaceae bacterium]